MNVHARIVANAGWITGIYTNGERVYDITQVPRARQLDALAGWIFRTISDHPMSVPVLVRYIRIQRPRILPEAIERAIGCMQSRGMLELDSRSRLRIKGFLPIGFSISRTGT